MRKREQFAVSLRKEKRSAIIAKKRRGLLSGRMGQQQPQPRAGENRDQSNPEYGGYHKFTNENQAMFDQLIRDIAPNFQGISDPVSISYDFVLI